ncbi:MAG: GIY-YIG nuclease family protein [Patescibacteria group bacterium]|nr:GIY-YIG nuclease family protein [Patescibacteria group bacterium]
MFYVYVLQSLRTKELYTGYTSNLKKRLEEHNCSRNISTKHAIPWKLIYYEACLNILDAKRREKYLKTSQGIKLMQRRLKEYFYSYKYRVSTAGEKS